MAPSLSTVDEEEERLLTDKFSYALRNLQRRTTTTQPPILMLAIPLSYSSSGTIKIHYIQLPLVYF